MKKAEKSVEQRFSEMDVHLQGKSDSESEDEGRSSRWPRHNGLKDAFTREVEERLYFQKKRKQDADFAKAHPWKVQKWNIKTIDGRMEWVQEWGDPLDPEDVERIEKMKREEEGAERERKEREAYERYKFFEKEVMKLTSNHLVLPNDCGEGVVPPLELLTKSGRTYICRLGNVSKSGSYNDFNVIPMSVCVKLRDLTKTLKEQYNPLCEARLLYEARQNPEEGDDPINLRIPTREMLLKDYVVAIRTEKGFERGKILGTLRDDNPNKWFVRRLDYGCTEVYDFEDIWYLQRELFYALRPTAINATAYGFPGVDWVWTEEDRQKFEMIVGKKPLAVRFMSREELFDKDEPTWEVMIHEYDEETEKITQLHLERVFLNAVGRGKELLGSAVTQTDEAPPIARFSSNKYFNN